MALDLEGLLQPVSEAEPAGPDLSYDPDFRRISRELEDVAGKDAPGDDPNVGPALDTAAALLVRSRDFWVAAHGACFALYAGRLDAMADMIRAMTVIAANFWDTAHPALDEGSDPAGGRREAARQLTSFGLVLKHLERMPLAPLKSKGRISFKDITGSADERATGQQMLDQVAEPIRRAIDETPAEGWQGLSGQLDTLIALSAELVAAFGEKVYSGQEPDLSPFTGTLARLKRLSDSVVARKIPATEADMAVEGSSEGGAPAVRGPISGRAQAVQQLEQVKAYFQQAEPSSPLPLLIDRVIRLAGMNFMELMQNIAPNGFDDAQRLLEPPQPEGS